jgi:hypothetical protein
MAAQVTAPMVGEPAARQRAWRAAQRRLERRRIPVPALALALAMLTVGTVAACEAKERAVDCAKLAISVSRSYDELERTALTAALDEEPEQLTDALRRDAEKVRDRTDDVDVRKAADSVLTAAESVQESISEGGTPDLSALGTATAELTRACAPG